MKYNKVINGGGIVNEFAEIDNFWSSRYCVDAYLLRQEFSNEAIDKYEKYLKYEYGNKFILYKGHIIRNNTDDLFLDGVMEASNNYYYWKYFLNKNYKCSFLGGSYAVYKNYFTMMPSRAVDIFSNNCEDLKMRDNDMVLQMHKYPFILVSERESKIHQCANILHTIRIVGYKKDYAVRALKIYKNRHKICIEEIRNVYNITKGYYEEVYKWAKMR